MFHLTDALFKEEMPARAKSLYIRTFNKYHKLDGGDEEIALHLARKAVEKNYVKLNDRWIPKDAAEVIVRHDIDTGTSSSDEDKDEYTVSPQQRSQPQQRFVNKLKRSSPMSNVYLGAATADVTADNIRPRLNQKTLTAEAADDISTTSDSNSSDSDYDDDEDSVGNNNNSSIDHGRNGGNRTVNGRRFNTKFSASPLPKRFR